MLFEHQENWNDQIEKLQKILETKYDRNNLDPIFEQLLLLYLFPDPTGTTTSFDVQQKMNDVGGGAIEVLQDLIMLEMEDGRRRNRKYKYEMSSSSRLNKVKVISISVYSAP